MPNDFRPESDVQLIPFYQYDPEIHEIDYRYIPQTSGETYTAFNPTFGATDYRFFPYPRPFYPMYGGFGYGYHPYYGGFHGYPYGYGGYGGYGGFHHGSSSR